MYGAKVATAQKITGDELAMRAQEMYDNGNARIVTIQRSKKAPLAFTTSHAFPTPTP